VSSAAPIDPILWDAIASLPLLDQHCHGVLRDDPTDSIANLGKPGPLSPQLVTALDGFVTK